MDEATVRAMLGQHFARGDPTSVTLTYHDDAVLEFPQSGERFAGVENLREWRSSYPASTTVEFRDIRGRDDLWVAEISIRYDQGDWNFGVSILEFRGDKIARESIYVTEGLGPTRLAGPMEIRALAPLLGSGVAALPGTPASHAERASSPRCRCRNPDLTREARPLQAAAAASSCATTSGPVRGPRCPGQRTAGRSPASFRIARLACAGSRL